MSNVGTPPKWFWIIGITGLLWNLLGVMAYLSQVTMNPEVLTTLPIDQQALYANIPSWANAAFAVAVWGGVAGCLGLLLKKALAMPLLLVSLLGLIVQMFHSFVLSNSFEVFGPSGLVMPVMVFTTACYLLWLSIHAKGNGWLD